MQVAQPLPYLHVVDGAQDVHVLAVLVGYDRELDLRPLGHHLGQQVLQGRLLGGLRAGGYDGVLHSTNLGIQQDLQGCTKQASAFRGVLLLACTEHC